MDVEALEFDAASFDVVTVRIAPHHFLDIDRSIAEVARVLRPGGAYVVEDSVVPEDPELDRFLNDIETMRDPTHIRSLTEREWRSKLEAAGLRPVRSTLCPKAHGISEWTARAGLDAHGTDKVYAAFAAATPAAVRAFSIEYEAGRATRFIDDKLVIRAEKPAES